MIVYADIYVDQEITGVVFFLKSNQHISRKTFIPLRYALFQVGLKQQTTLARRPIYL